jgi:hypothetical protein
VVKLYRGFDFGCTVGLHQGVVVSVVVGWSVGVYVDQWVGAGAGGKVRHQVGPTFGGYVGGTRQWAGVCPQEVRVLQHVPTGVYCACLAVLPCVMFCAVQLRVLCAPTTCECAVPLF